VGTVGNLKMIDKMESAVFDRQKFCELQLALDQGLKNHPYYSFDSSSVFGQCHLEKEG